MTGEPAEWMENWCDRVKNNGAQLFETGLTINLTPDAQTVLLLAKNLAKGSLLFN